MHPLYPIGQSLRSSTFGAQHSPKKGNKPSELRISSMRWLYVVTIVGIILPTELFAFTTDFRQEKWTYQGTWGFSFQKTTSTEKRLSFPSRRTVVKLINILNSSRTTSFSPASMFTTVLIYELLHSSWYWKFFRSYQNWAALSFFIFISVQFISSFIFII